MKPAENLSLCQQILTEHLLGAGHLDPWGCNGQQQEDPGLEEA